MTGSSKFSIHRGLEKALSNLAATKARPCLLFAQVKDLPLNPRSIKSVAIVISENSLTEVIDGGWILSFSLARRMALKLPMTHQGRAVEEMFSR